MKPHSTPQRTRRPGVTACLIASASCIVLCFEAALAQDLGRVTIDAARCTALESADERLACFEAQVDDARSSERNESRSPAPAASVPPAAGAQPRTEWVGTIASLNQRLPNRYVITLDSGLVWEQQVAERYPLRVGQRVRIYETRWGSSQRLEADGLKGFIQVARVP